jgi:flavodoxin
MKMRAFALGFLLSLSAVAGAAQGTGPEQQSSGSGGAPAAAPMSPGHRKVLVAYFSHSGNTREIAKQIQQHTGGDLFEIVTVKPYPRDYHECVEQAKAELASNAKPALKTKVSGLASYDVVFIGYPNWWGTIPRPVAVFLTDYDFSGKTLAPFCTHAGSRLGQSVGDIAELCPTAKVLEGLAVRGAYVKTAQNEVAAWLEKIGVTDKK